MIRLCDAEEAIKILNEPQTIERLGTVTEKLTVQPWIIENGKYRLMFVFWLVSVGVYEMHIACPKDSIIRCRDMAKEAIQFAFEHGANKVVTNCPEGKIANMARKIGMVEFNQEHNRIWFEVKYGCWSSNNR